MDARISFRTRRPSRVPGRLAGVLAQLAPLLCCAQFREPDVQVLHTLSGEVSGEGFGWAISPLRDIDGDGATDLIVGAPFAGAGGSNDGRLDVFSGRSGVRRFRFAGASGELLGYAMADAGDVDRDGVADVAAGAPGSGKVYVYSGRTGAVLRVLIGEHAGDRFGASVGGIARLGRHGCPGLVVGAPGFTGAGPGTGRAYLYDGCSGRLQHTFDGAGAGDLFGAGAAGTPDLDGDGHGDLIIGARKAGADRRGRSYVYSGASGRPILPTLAPLPSGLDFGWFFVAGLNDVDGDGRPDLYVGDFDDATSGPGSGRAYVFSGRTGASLYQFVGAAGDGTGPGRGAGDVNGDGRADIIVGSYTASDAAAGAGKVTVYGGCRGDALRTFTGTVAGSNLGFDAVGIGDLNGDREADFALAAASNDTVYLVAGSRTCIADFNRDGRIDGHDALAYLRAWLGREPRADTDCDGKVTDEDLERFARATLFGCG